MYWRGICASRNLFFSGSGLEKLSFQIFTGRGRGRGSSKNATSKFALAAPKQPGWYREAPRPDVSDFSATRKIGLSCEDARHAALSCVRICISNPLTSISLSLCGLLYLHTSRPCPEKIQIWSSLTTRPGAESYGLLG